MIKEKEVLTEHNHYHGTCSYKRISWTAVLVGAVIAVGLGFLLNLFGMAIGLNAITTNSSTGASAIAIGGLIGIIIAVIASMMVAGYAAGYLGRWYSPQRNLGILYGFTTWSVALLLSAVVAAPVSHYATTYFNVMNGGTSLVINKNASVDNNAITVEKQKTNNGENQPSTTVTTSADNLAYGAIILFALFFIGAFSTCVGACWAMTCKRDD